MTQPQEIITINIGQAGCQMGTQITKQYMAEHGIDEYGALKSGQSIDEKGALKSEEDDTSFTSFFAEHSDNKYVPRSITVDLDPAPVDAIRNELPDLFLPESLISGKEDTGNNFARGHLVLGKEIKDRVSDMIRKMVDGCENVAGFIINHSVGGGTGSGLGTLILEQLQINYRKKAKIGMHIYGAPKFASSVVEPYNAMLTTRCLLDHTDVSMVFDNLALKSICQKQLDVQTPSWDDINAVVAKAISGITSPYRFAPPSDNNLKQERLSDLQQDLVPFPRLHFMTGSLSPLLSPKKYKQFQSTVGEITNHVLQPMNMLVNYPQFDPDEDKYMGIKMNYRGQVNLTKDVEPVLDKILMAEKVSFVEWIPAEFSTNVRPSVAPVQPEVVMMGNNVAISRFFTERISKKYDKMYSQRAYVHWYTAEGMEEGEFSEAREELGFLEKDYQDVVTEQAGDDDEGDDEFLQQKKGKKDKRMPQHHSSQKQRVGHVHSHKAPPRKSQP